MKEAISHCIVGGRSNHAWFVLTYLLGYPKVRLTVSRSPLVRASVAWSIQSFGTTITVTPLQGNVGNGMASQVACITVFDRVSSTIEGHMLRRDGGNFPEPTSFHDSKGV